MAVIVMVVAAAAVAAVALWLPWVLWQLACVNACLYMSLCVRIYIKTRVRMRAFNNMYYSCALAHV